MQNVFARRKRTHVRRVECYLHIVNTAATTYTHIYMYINHLLVKCGIHTYKVPLLTTVVAHANAFILYTYILGVLTSYIIRL